MTVDALGALGTWQVSECREYDFIYFGVFNFKLGAAGFAHM